MAGVLVCHSPPPPPAKFQMLPPNYIRQLKAPGENVFAKTSGSNLAKGCGDYSSQDGMIHLWVHRDTDDAPVGRSLGEEERHNVTQLPPSLCSSPMSITKQDEQPRRKVFKAYGLQKVLRKFCFWSPRSPSLSPFCHPRKWREANSPRFRQQSIQASCRPPTKAPEDFSSWGVVAAEQGTASRLSVLLPLATFPPN